MKSPFDSAGIIIVCILGVIVLFNANNYSQSLYQGPAFGTITGGVIVSTDDFLDHPETLPEKTYASPFRPQGLILPGSLIDNKYDNSIPRAPLNSNELYDPVVSLFTRQNIHSPAVIIDFDGSRMPSSPWYPPDPHIAAGPNHILVVDNGRFFIYDKLSHHLKEIYARDWFNSLVPNSSPFDCQVFYDHYGGRWVQEWLIKDSNNSTSYWLISVSDDSDPIGQWRNYAFPNHLNGTANALNWGDYPKIGFDQQALYISARQLNFTTNSFYYSKLRIIPSAQIYDFSNNLIEYRDFWDFKEPDSLGITVDGPLIPAFHYDSTQSAYLIVDSPYLTSNFVTIWRIADPLAGNPTVSAINVPIVANLTPPNASQMGGAAEIFSDRRRYRNSVVKDGHLWTANSVAGGASNQYAFLHYLRIDLATFTAVEDISFGADGYHYIYPAVTLDEDNNLYLAFTRTGNQEYASAAYTGRRAGDPSGLSPSSIIKTGEAFYENRDPDLRNRWGDYIGIALDPVDHHVVWGFIEYAASPANTWAVRVGALTQKYTLRGILKNAVSGLPVPMARIHVSETNQTTQTDSSGLFNLGAPSPTITMDFSAFAHRDTTSPATLTAYGSDSIEILMQPEIVSSISGHVRDDSGNGIASQMRFFVRGNPSPLPYAVTRSDSNGYYQVQTIIGNYNIEIEPEAPYLSRRIENISLSPSPLNLDITLKAADFLLVDDDGGASYEEYYINTLNTFHNTYYLWENDSMGPPPGTVREAFKDKVMIWFTGDSSSIPLTIAEQNEIVDHLNSGHKLFLTGQDITEYSAGSGLLDTLGITFSSNTMIAQVRGVVGSPVSDGLVLLIDGSGGANNQESQDMLTIVDSSKAQAIFHYGSNVNRIAGIVYSNPQTYTQAVFLGFGFEAITMETGRVTLMQRILQSFGVVVPIEPISRRIPKQVELYQNYPNPFNPTTVIRWQLTLPGPVKLEIYNLRGQKVKVLLSASLLSGFHSVEFDASGLGSGIYFYRLQAGPHVETRKMVVLK